MMEAVRTSKTLVYLDETTRRYISEGCHLHTRRRENLKSHPPAMLICKLLGTKITAIIRNFMTLC
jgi:hypothetical protein